MELEAKGSFLSMQLKTIISIIVISIFTQNSVNAQRDVIDRVVAVVGNEIILASELASQIQLAALQPGYQPKTSAELEKLRDRTLEGMISDRLFLIAAKDDSTISIRAADVERALDDQLARMQGNFESQQAFQQALDAEGLTIRELRKKFRSEVENQLLKQRYIQKQLYGVSVSRHEVEEFYKQFKDSIPIQPEALKLAHILIPVQASQEVEDSVKAMAEELRQRVLDGADFSALSAQYSSFGAGANGGDLGYVSKSDVVEEFARAAFNLLPGDISGVIRTQFGYHVIKAEDRNVDKMKLRHILLGVQPSADDSVRSFQLADSLLSELSSGGKFEELAKIFSIDNDTRARGGELGWFASDKLPQEFARELAGQTTAGEIKGPVSSQFGLHIIKLLEYQAEKQYTLEEDFDKIKELARQDKTGRMVDNSILEIKEKTFIEYRVDEL